MSERESVDIADTALPATRYPLPPDYFQAPGDLRNFAKSAVRALQVLDQFATRRQPLRAVEIGQSLDLHPSSADQLLKTMVDSGYLLFDDRSKVYFPSSRLGLFANWLSETPLGGLDRLIEHIQTIVNERVVISFRQGNDMQLALAKGRRDGVPECVTPGVRFPLFNSGTGIAALCTYSDPEIRQIAERAKRYRRDRHVCVDDVLLQVLVARKTGYAINLHEAPERLVLAAPLAGEGLPRGAAISVTGPRERILPQVDAIVDAFADILPTYLSGQGPKARNIRLRSSRKTKPNN